MYLKHLLGVTFFFSQTTIACSNRGKNVAFYWSAKLIKRELYGTIVSIVPWFGVFLLFSPSRSHIPTDFMSPLILTCKFLRRKIDRYYNVD